MSDLDELRAMLDRAKIPHTVEAVEDPRATGHSAAVLPGSIAVTIPSNWIPGGDEGGREQPYSGGYSGFFSEIVFGPDGALLAVWAWE